MELKSILNKKDSTDILNSFHRIIIDEFSSLILLEISKMLRQMSAQ